MDMKINLKKYLRQYKKKNKELIQHQIAYNLKQFQEQSTGNFNVKIAVFVAKIENLEVVLNVKIWNFDDIVKGRKGDYVCLGIIQRGDDDGK